MKKLNGKNTFAALACGFLMMGFVFTGCETAFDERDDSEIAEEASSASEQAGCEDSVLPASRNLKTYSDAERAEMKKIISEGIKDYEDAKAASKDKKSTFEYKGYAGAMTRISAYSLDKLIADLGTDSPEAKEWIAVGTRTIDAVTKFIDAYLNKCTGGLYEVAINIFFPTATTVDPNIKLIQDGINRIEKSVTEIQNSLDNICSEIIAAADREILSDRMDYANTTGNDFEVFGQFISKNMENGFLDYRHYLELKGKLYQNNYNSPEKLWTEAYNYLTGFYSTVGRDYGKMYKAVAEANCPWRYQSNALMRDFINRELRAGTQAYTVINTLYDPENNGNVYYEALVGYLMGNRSQAEKDEGCVAEPSMTTEMYSKLISPVMSGNPYATINKEEYNDFMDHIQARVAKLNDSELNAVVDLCFAAKDKWDNVNGYYESFVDSLTSIPVVDDKAGEITCNIPGAKYTFRTFMRSIDYADSFKTFSDTCLESNWKWVVENTSWSTEHLTPIDHSNQLAGNDNWMKLFNGGSFMNSHNEIKCAWNGLSITKDVYEKIVKWYEAHDVTVTNGTLSYVTIVEGEDADGNAVTYRAGMKSKADKIMESNIKNILYYEAGIMCTSSKVAVPNGNTGFKLEKKGNGEWNIAYVWTASCKVEYFDASDSKLNSCDFTVLDGYACGNSDDSVSYMYRPSYYGDTYSSVRSQSFVMLDPVSKNW